MLTNALGIMFNELGAAKSKTEVEAVGHKMDIAMKNDAKIQDADFLSLDMDAKFSDDIFILISFYRLIYRIMIEQFCGKQILP